MTTLDSFLPPGWLPALLGLLGCVIAALIVHAAALRIALRVAGRSEGSATRSLLTRSRRPVQLVFALLAVRLGLPLLPLEADFIGPVQHFVGIVLIAAMTWAVIRAVSVIEDAIASRHRIDVSDNLLARKVRTQARLLSRTAMIIAGTVGVAAILMTFPTIRQLGTSLLASAGILGIVVGFAARSTVGNLIAGIQLALTQPIRLDDVVIVEGEWGRIEEITTTYVVIGIWDQRRLVVPLSYFIEQPFQNWTRSTADILGSVFIHTDYSVPVDAIRTELSRIVEEEADGLWDRKVCVLQVTDAKEFTLELRALVSAASSSNAWDLRCLVREKLVKFLQAEYPHCLPRVRAEVAS